MEQSLEFFNLNIEEAQNFIKAKLTLNKILVLINIHLDLEAENELLSENQLWELLNEFESTDFKIIRVLLINVDIEDENPLQNIKIENYANNRSLELVDKILALLRENGYLLPEAMSNIALNIRMAIEENAAATSRERPSFLNQILSKEGTPAASSTTTPARR